MRGGLQGTVEGPERPWMLGGRLEQIQMPNRAVLDTATTGMRYAMSYTTSSSVSYTLYTVDFSDALPVLRPATCSNNQKNRRTHRILGGVVNADRIAARPGN